MENPLARAGGVMMPAVAAARILSLVAGSGALVNVSPFRPPPGHYARLGSIAKIPPKNKFKKIREIDWGHTYTCNNLTSFQCEVKLPETECMSNQLKNLA